MPRSRLESLAPEILLLIVQQILRPTDLGNLCIVSRTLRSTATQLLYEWVMIDLTTSAPENPKLTPSHPGIASLRDLYFFDLNEDAMRSGIASSSSSRLSHWAKIACAGYREKSPLLLYHRYCTKNAQSPTGSRCIEPQDSIVIRPGYSIHWQGRCSLPGWFL